MRKAQSESAAGAVSAALYIALMSRGRYPAPMDPTSKPDTRDPAKAPVSSEKRSPETYGATPALWMEMAIEAKSSRVFLMFAPVMEITAI